MNPHDAALVREALRLYRRYAVEVVEHFGLCPWAERSRQQGNTREHVFLQENQEDITEALNVIFEFMQAPSVEVGLFIFPKLNLCHTDFERFVGRLREADAARHELGKIPFAMAAFHPDAPLDLGSPERLIPFIRRTPDPTIQLVREQVLDRVRGAAPQGTQFVDLRLLTPGAFAADPPCSLRDRIARGNYEQVRRRGIEGLRAVQDNIIEDRNRTYQKLLASVPARS